MAQEFSRRSLLGAAAAGLAGSIAGRAQVSGLVPDGGTPPFRLPLGALDFLDRKQYIHNMEIHATLPGSTISGGEPLMAMWAKGKQRLLPAGGGFIDVTEPTKPVVLNKGVVKGNGAVVEFNSDLKKWIMMCTAAAPLTSATPRVSERRLRQGIARSVCKFQGPARHPQLRHHRSHQARVARRVQHRREGQRHTTTTFTTAVSTRTWIAWWDDQLRLENHQRPYSNAIMIVNMSDPGKVKEVSRWWVPGQRLGEEAEYKKYIFAGDRASWTGNHGALSVPKRVEDGGKFGYGGFGAFGMYVMDLSDITKPKPAGKVQYEFNALGTIPFHTCYPVISDAAHPRLQNLIVATHEALEADCREVYHTPYVVDVKDPRNPKIIGFFPRPAAPPEAPYSDFCFARGRFGSHNTQCWLAPGISRPEIVAIAWFNAGIRVFDLSNPTEPKEVGYFVPPHEGEIDNYESWWRGSTENVFVEWDRNLIWIGTHAGSYCLSCPALGKPVLEPRKVERWSVAHCNAGWDDQTSRSFYFGRSTRQVG